MVLSEMLKLIKEERSLRSPKREKDEEEEGGEKKENVETVKTGIDFPKLLPPEQPDAAMRCGDWLSIVGCSPQRHRTTGSSA